MRIQHNIAAMNAYRNYNLNTSAVTKNLEKLSSGYKINRAGDDAAGLAISEKMRAQISGLEAASKNVKDGISLVKTAEGAMQEVQDMLNRMVTLATQSANGTYDNETDRAALQQEVDQLNSEIDRIADSANFNGIKLLDGSLDANGRRATTTTQINDMVMSSNTYGTDANGGALANTEGGLELTGVNLGSGNTDLYTSDKSIRYHKDAAEGGKTAFTIDLDGTSNSNFTQGKTIEGLVLGLDGGQATSTATGALNNALYLDAAGTKRVEYNVTSDQSGISSENIAKSIMETIEKNGGKVYIKVGTAGTASGNANGQELIEYNVTLEDGDKLRFEMSDKGYNDAATYAQRTGNTANYFQGNFNVGLNYKPTANAPAAGSLEETFTNYVNGETTHPATSNINEGTTPAGTIYAEALIRFDKANDGNANDGLNDVDEFFADGAGIKLGDDYYVFAQTDAVFNGEYADNVHVVDIRDLETLKGATADADDLRKALDRLSTAAKDNEMFDVQVAKGGDALVITERTTYTGDANLTEKDSGLEKQIQKFESVTSKTVVEKEAGTALTLQIGDTSDDFNQLKVNIGDVHATALGVDKINVGNQTDAQSAINTIKSAINQVSSIRGTLGATQNRLEHTSNNLSVMTENIQDAESTIRDTDIAEEMMSYTKNNILVQSAQAMLAQANQIPQGVLQLLG
ncbi:flagellin [Oscillospiraceae bacterium 44-5]